MSNSQDNFTPSREDLAALHTQQLDQQVMQEDMEVQQQNCKQSEPSSSPPPHHRQVLQGWLNKNMKIKMSDSRTIVGVFLCTDCHRNIILGSSLEYLKDEESEEPRMLGLAMIPGEHIVSIHIDDFLAAKNSKSAKEVEEEEESEKEVEEEEEGSADAASL